MNVVKRQQQNTIRNRSSRSKKLIIIKKNKNNKVPRQKQKSTVTNNSEYGSKLLREQLVKEELVKLTDAVRKKYKSLILENQSIDRYFESFTKPIVVPIEKAVNTIIKRQSKEAAQVMENPIKQEQSVKKEEDKEENKFQTKKVGRNKLASSASSITDDDEDDDTLNRTLDRSTQTETPESLTQTYLYKLNDPSVRNSLDSTYGVKYDGRGGTTIGSEKISFTKTHVILNERAFKATRGLLELLFMKAPNNTVVTNDDLKSYKQILLESKAYRQMYSLEKPINANRGQKYVNVISVLFPSTSRATRAGSTSDTADAADNGSSSSKTQQGRGLVGRKNPLPYTNNLNSLVNRLRVLWLSTNAGHTGHADEISYITDTLRDYRVIA